MIPFITYREQDENGNLQYFVCQKEFPHYVGIIATRPIEGSIYQVAISGYNLWVTFHGTLRGNMIPLFRDIEKEIGYVYHGMAAWYLEERILKDLKRYKKYVYRN